MTQQKQTIEKQKQSDKFKAVFNTPDGQDVLEELKNLAGYDKISFSANHDGSIDPYKLAMNEGARRLILAINDLLNFKADKPIENKHKNKKI